MPLTIASAPLPEVADLVVLSPNTPVINYSLPDGAADRFEALGLELFIDPRTHYSWFGFAQEDVDPHDRWLARSIEPFLQGSKHIQWYALGRENPAKSDLVVAGDFSLMSRLGKLYVNFTTAYEISIGMNRTRSVPWIFMHYQVFGNFDFDMMATLPKKVDWRELHQIMHHLDEWRVANDAQDLPRELILRMHGLGPALDHKVNCRLGIPGSAHAAAHL